MDLFLNQPRSSAPPSEAGRVRSDVGRSNALFLADLDDHPIEEVRRRYAAGEYGKDLHVPSLRGWARLAGKAI